MQSLPQLVGSLGLWAENRHEGCTMLGDTVDVALEVRQLVEQRAEVRQQRGQLFEECVSMRAEQTGPFEEPVQMRGHGIPMALQHRCMPTEQWRVTKQLADCDADVPPL